MNFSREIVRWYELNKRDLPWRNTKDPYLIWLSEIILQQTRVEQGLPYYNKFKKRFPSVRYLAKATEQEVLKLWQGLGYYSRARNLHYTAKLICKDLEGKFPTTKNEILKLKGVGEYTASAIASFAFGLPEAVVDGNVFRLLSRYFGISTSIDSHSAKKEFSDLANKLLGKNDPAVFNQAIMEFGSKQCKPTNPDCKNCPLCSSCYAFKNNMQDALPVKKRKTAPVPRYFHYFVIRNKNGLYLQKRTGNDIWRNMYEFPLIESERLISEKDLSRSKEWILLFGRKKIIFKPFGSDFRHILSHQIIHARFFEIKSPLRLTGKDFNLVSDKELSKLPLSRLMDKFLKSIV